MKVLLRIKKTPRYYILKSQMSLFGGMPDTHPEKVTVHGKHKTFIATRHKKNAVVTPSAPIAGHGKETSPRPALHEMTPDEYVISLGQNNFSVKNNMAYSEHRAIVNRAVKDGKAIPAKVIHEYPHLRDSNSHQTAQVAANPKDSGLQQRSYNTFGSEGERIIEGMYGPDLPGGIELQHNKETGRVKVFNSVTGRELGDISPDGNINPTSPTYEPHLQRTKESIQNAIEKYAINQELNRASGYTTGENRQVAQLRGDLAVRNR